MTPRDEALVRQCKELKKEAQYWATAYQNEVKHRREAERSAREAHGRASDTQSASMKSTVWLQRKVKAQAAQLAALQEKVKRLKWQRYKALGYAWGARRALADHRHSAYDGKPRYVTPERYGGIPPWRTAGEIEHS